jgi:exosome complex exonuclease DIS3/RRP44
MISLTCQVHIADVSHYVKPGTALDVEGSYRGTSVYLVDRRIDMLPSLLSTNLCSLRSNIDRLTFSVLWEVDSGANIINTSFHKAVINSVHSFTYAQAQERIDSENTDNITWACKTLNNLAKKLKQRRIDAGALMLASTEVKFLIDRESQTPTDVEMYQLKEANSLVEEFMLLANISVAKQILSSFPTFALLRKHPEPSPENFATLIKAAKCVGFPINVESSKKLADSLDKAVIPSYSFFNKLIRIIATRAMSQAVYFSSGDCSPAEFHHYGLASPVYTHFTSPIRRYADIVVHRLLAASMGIIPLPAEIQDRDRVREMAENINRRHRMAQLVSRASTELFTLIYFENRTVIETGMIVSVRSNGFRVMIPRYGIEAAINLFNPGNNKNIISVQDLPDEEELAEETKENHQIKPSFPGSQAVKNPYTFDEENFCLKGPNGEQYKIFEQVKVQINVEQGKNRRKWLNIQLADKNSQITQEIKEYKTMHKDNQTSAKDEDINDTATAMADDSVVANEGEKVFLDERELDGAARELTMQVEPVDRDNSSSGKQSKLAAKNKSAQLTHKKQAANSDQKRQKSNK